MTLKKKKVKTEVKPDKKNKFSERAYQVKRLEPQSEAQFHYITEIENNVITFGVGASGSGKTYVATALAGQLLASGKIRKIIITRPAVESGRGLGYLKGSLEEKYEPYIAPVRAVLVSRHGKGWFESQVKNGNIECVPLEFMMGKTFDNSFVIADEMQNATPKEMFILLSRVGEYSKVVVNGDYKMQTVIKGDSGIQDAIERLEGVDGVSVFEFTSDDCVRSGIAREIIKRYED